MAPALIAAIGVPLLAQLIGEALSRIDNPAAKTAAKALEGVEQALKSGQIAPGEIAEANRHAEKMAELRLKEYETALAEINESLRTEVESEDIYVRRMRPTFGYLMALTWAAQMLGVAYIMVFRTEQASIVMQAVESLSLIWAVGLSVLGIYVYRRSDDKRL